MLPALYSILLAIFCFVCIDHSSAETWDESYYEPQYYTDEESSDSSVDDSEEDGGSLSSEPESRGSVSSVGEPTPAPLPQDHPCAEEEEELGIPLQLCGKECISEDATCCDEKNSTYCEYGEECCESSATGCMPEGDVCCGFSVMVPPKVLPEWCPAGTFCMSVNPGEIPWCQIELPVEPDPGSWA